MFKSNTTIAADSGIGALLSNKMLKQQPILQLKNYSNRKIKKLFRKKIIMKLVNMLQKIVQIQHREYSKYPIITGEFTLHRLKRNLK